MSLTLPDTVRIRSLSQVHFIVISPLINPAIKLLPLVFRHQPRIVLRASDPVRLDLNLIFDDVQGWNFSIDGLLAHCSSPRLNNSSGIHDPLGYSRMMTFVCSMPFSALNI